MERWPVVAEPFGPCAIRDTERVVPDRSMKRGRAASLLVVDNSDP